MSGKIYFIIERCEPTPMVGFEFGYSIIERAESAMWGTGRSFESVAGIRWLNDLEGFERYITDSAEKLDLALKVLGDRIFPTTTEGAKAFLLAAEEISRFDDAMFAVHELNVPLAE